MEEGFDTAYFAATVRQQAVLALVQQGRISHGRGAEMLDMSPAEFFDLLATANIPHLDYAPEELDADAAALRKAFPTGQHS